MMRHNDIKTAFIATSLCFFSAYSANALEMKEIGNFKIGDGEGYAAHHLLATSIFITKIINDRLIAADFDNRIIKFKH